MAQHELTMLEFVAHLRRLLGVDNPNTLVIDDEQERVQLSYYDAESIELADAEQTVIKTRTGETVRLGDITRAETQPLSGSITRENQRYTSYINWEYVGTDQMRLAFLKRVLESLDLPYGFHAEESQREFFSEEEEEELTFAIVLTVLLIFMMLAALFESVTAPFLVILAVPMSLVGVVVAFWLTRSSFDSSARIGLILLFGVVVNNAILLVSRFRTEAALALRDRFGADPSRRLALFGDTTVQPGGTDLWELPRGESCGLLLRSAARAVRIRIRSILLTTGTTIVGLAPLLVHFRETEDKDIWENLALASIGGLASSTVLVLLALPAFYYAAVRFVGWPWRTAWHRSQRFGRSVMITGALYAFLLPASVAVALYVANTTYRVTEPGVEVALTDAHRHALKTAGIAMAATVALWSASYGWRRAWWKGLAAFLAGALVTALTVSALALLDLPFAKDLPGLLWLQRNAVLLCSVWLPATVLIRLTDRLTASLRRDKTVIA
jgi:hypothetical protein